MTRSSSTDRLTTVPAVGRRALIGITVLALVLPAPVRSQESTEPTPEEQSSEATPRRRGTGQRDRADTTSGESGARRGTGERDQVGEDPRRGGTRDDVTSADGDPAGTVAPNERVRDLPTGEAPTSVSPQSIRLPNGEGSIEGMGESFAPVLSSGTATFSVPIAVPAGRHGVQPSFGLSYGSSNGNGIVGIGWSMGVPMIARQTDRGTPRYVDSPRYQLGEDRFIYNGGQELVPVDSEAMATIDAIGGNYGSATEVIPQVLHGWQQYRAKVEGAFMRFFRSPDSTRWVVQSLDGTRFEFGILPTDEGGPATMNRTAAVQSEGPNGTGRIYSWLLTRMSDSHGSTVYYQYFENGSARYLSDAYYLSPASCAAGTTVSPRTTRRCTTDFANYGVRVRFEYETRPDQFTSYISGWGVTQALRLVRVTAFSAEESMGTRYLVRRFHLAYNPTLFHSLLTSVQVEGRSETTSARAPSVPVFARTREADVGAGFVGRRLPPMQFEYTTMPTSGPQAAGFGGLDASVRTAINSPPVSLDAALVDLFDVNGDGLSDVLVTDAARYQTRDGRPGVGVFWNGFVGTNATPAGRGATFSAATVVPLDNGADVILRYTNPNLLGMDVDGDGRGDFMHLPPTLGHGWITPARLVPEPAASPALQHWAFVHTPRPIGTSNDPQIKLAQDGTFYRVLDVNNDHLIDVVRTTGTSMQTWLNLGWVPGGEGRFGHAELGTTGWLIRPEPVVTCLPHDGLPLDFGSGEVRVGDMNGDGLADLIRMRRGRITYWPGRGGPVWGEGPSQCPAGFASDRDIEMTTPPQEVNAELAGVFLQDVDGDGADDVVQVRYRELDVWFNKSGRAFTSRITITSPFAPDFASNLRFVDLDGSGTTDLVYGRANDWRYLDLLGGHRPRLLARVHNGLGATTSLEYGSSVEDYLRDLGDATNCSGATCERFTWDGVRGDRCDDVIDRYADACVYRSGGSPVISSVVRRVQTTDNFVAVTGRSQVSTQEFAYHDGYYEGIEQEFRGFGAADAHVLGDATVGGMWTRTWFHQGRRPNEIATTRLAENPEEAFKGSTYLTEVFDEGGRYASTTHTMFTLRHLATGLDARPIAFAYASRTDSFMYDTASYAANAAIASLPSMQKEAVDSSGQQVSMSGTAETRGVRVRGQVYVWTRNESVDVDNLGNVSRSVANGRVHGSGDGPGTNDDVPYSEGIGSVNEPTMLGNDGEGWLRRSTRTATTNVSFAREYGATTTVHNAAGDATSQFQIVAKAKELEFGGDEDAPGYIYGSQRIETSSSFDPFGSVVEACAGADLASAPASRCLRYSTTTFDRDFAQLPTEEAIATNVNETTGEIETLGTSATWERGLGAMLAMTDPNALVTQLGFDGLGRKSFVDLPDGVDCTAPEAEQQFSYRLANETTLPVNYVETASDTRDTSSGACIGAKLARARAYVDGLGRARGAISIAPDEKPGALLVAGIVELDARGQPRTVYDPRWVPADWTLASPSVVLTPSSTTLHTLASYDPFGRVVSTTAQDGSTARSEYHADATWSFDPNDDPQQNPGTPQHWGTPTIQRIDGHGRAIEQVQLLRQPGESLGSVRFLHLVSIYREDGKVTRVIRAETDSAAPYVSAAVLSNHSVERTFYFDTAGRRVSATDPDSDSRKAFRTEANRHWRYLFNRVGDLVAVRDPRGCGQDFFYDRAGRLVAEDYITCAEAQIGGDGSVGTIGGAIALDVEGDRPVDAIYHYDAQPSWVPSGIEPAAPSGAALKGRATGVTDRAQRSASSYDARGNVVWTARQVALIPLEADLAPASHVLSGDSPSIDADDTTAPSTPTYDFATGHTYAIRTYFDAGGRPFRREYPLDPDWMLFDDPDSPLDDTPPTIEGRMTYNVRGLPETSTIHIGSATQTVLAGATYDAFGVPVKTMLRSATPTDAITQTTSYDNRHRPHAVRVERGGSGINGLAGTLNAVQVPFAELYDWDRGSNLVGITSQAGPTPFPDGRRQMRRTIAHDSLARVAQVSMEYLQDDVTWGPLDASTDWRDERERSSDGGPSNRRVDPMQSEPSPMLVPNAEHRVVDLTYEYDWLANMTVWDDDARMFHERSIGAISNGSDDSNGTGATPEFRPSALYLASNIRSSAGEPVDPRAGWLDIDYGEGGNVETLTVRGQCTDASGQICTDDPRLGVAARESRLLERCTCASEQHFQYRWDELNRLAEARRYDRLGGAGNWTLAARMRARYDSGNVRLVKQSIDPTPEAASPSERLHVYAFPDDFERVGVTVDRVGGTYSGSADLGTETEYHVGGAKVVHKRGTSEPGFERNRRVTIPISDLLGTASAVVDLDSGELLEMSTFHPNGGREMHWMSESQRTPLERSSFTGKEEDEEVGVSYFGQRYLMTRLGRWASPDPLSIGSMGGGEALNGFHYVAGNVLQAKDPDGLVKLEVDSGERRTERGRLLREGGRKVANSISNEARENHGVASTVTNTNGGAEITLDDDAAQRAAHDRTAARLRGELQAAGMNDRQIRRAMRRWERARSRVMAIINSSETYQLTTRTVDDRQLYAAIRSSTSTRINPFTWFVRDGSDWSSPWTTNLPSSGNGRDFSPLQVLIHERSHQSGCMSGSRGCRLDFPHTRTLREQATVEDQDQHNEALIRARRLGGRGDYFMDDPMRNNRISGHYLRRSGTAAEVSYAHPESIGSGEVGPR